jgi:SAM-dependent methyltransferase
MAAPAPPLDAWFNGALGTMLLEQERAAVARSLECAFGLHCLQVGSWGAPDTFLSLARTRRTALVATAGTPGAALIAEPSALALQSDSVDVILLPHTLEFARDPHEVLREVARVLTGEGELLVLGFEPFGGWSFRNAFTRGGFPPGIDRTIPAQRLADWLKLTGFEVGATERFLYIPPVAGLQHGRAAGFFERIGRRAWPRLSGAYLLKARKRVYSMTPVRLRSRLRTAVIGGLTEPAARRAS